MVLPDLAEQPRHFALGEATVIREWQRAVKWFGDKTRWQWEPW